MHNNHDPISRALGIVFFISLIMLVALTVVIIAEWMWREIMQPCCNRNPVKKPVPAFNYGRFTRAERRALRKQTMVARGTFEK